VEYEMSHAGHGEQINRALFYQNKEKELVYIIRTGDRTE
jgi:hypothetical protein